MDGVNEAGLQCIAEFVNSLVEEIDAIESADDDRSRRVYREIFSAGFQTTLKLSTDYDPDSKIPSRFSRALERNIAKFPSSQQDLCRSVYGIEEPDGRANAFVETQASESAIISRDLGWIRRLMQRPTLPIEDASKIRSKLLNHQFNSRFSQVSVDFRNTFLKELRSNLGKFTPEDQRAISLGVEGLDQEIIKLLEIIGSELSKWLEFVKKQSWPPNSLSRLVPLLKSILAVPFGVAFRNMPTTKSAIATKESFLLIMAICLTHSARRFDNAEVIHLIEELRHQFFYVEAHGDLMESWLKNRIKVVNEEFLQSTAKITADQKNHAALLARLQLVLRPGKWTSLEEWAVEQELVTIFGGGITPQHAVTPQTLAKALCLLGVPENVQIFDTIARIPIAGDEKRAEPRGADERFKRCLEAYPKQLPFCFSPFGAHKFGNLDITVQELPDGALQVAFGDEHGKWREMDADDFIQEYGPKQAPTVSYEAIYGCPPPLNYRPSPNALHQPNCPSMVRGAFPKGIAPPPRRVQLPRKQVEADQAVAPQPPPNQLASQAFPKRAPQLIPYLPRPMFQPMHQLAHPGPRPLLPLFQPMSNVMHQYSQLTHPARPIPKQLPHPAPHLVEPILEKPHAVSVFGIDDDEI